MNTDSNALSVFRWPLAWSMRRIVSGVETYAVMSRVDETRRLAGGSRSDRSHRHRDDRAELVGVE